MLIALGQAVTIVTTLLPFVDSLVYRTASYSESHTNQFLEIHEDYRLVGHAIESLLTDELDCGLRCVRNTKCQSYNCLSDEHLGNKTCQLNDQTRHSKPTEFRANRGCTYYGKDREITTDMPQIPKLIRLAKKDKKKTWKLVLEVNEERRGFNPSTPSRSCKDIVVNGIPVRSGEYWIDPENSGNPIKVFCDMSTNGGGWLFVANFEIDDSGPPSDWTTEPTYRGISNYYNRRMGISRTALHELRKHLPFTQLRFHCGKQHARILHVITVTNSTGEDVVQYFSGQTDMKPASCGSFVRMEDDNSQLAEHCANWGYNEITAEYDVGKWGGVPWLSSSSDEIMYDHALFISSASHWIVGKTGGRWECDDFHIPTNPVPRDFWRIFVR